MTYVIFHERNTGVDIIQHFSKRVVIHKPPRPGSIQASRNSIKIRIIVVVRANILCQLLKPSLLSKNFFAL